MDLHVANGKLNSGHPTPIPRRPAEAGHDEAGRLRLAFFDFPDVFEDFYPHYGVDRRQFATEWADTGNHAIVSVLQRRVGDVTWYAQSLEADVFEDRHRTVGCRVRFLPSSRLHRRLWKAFYLPDCAWRWRRMWRAFGTVASYLAPASWPLLTALREDRPDCFVVQDYGSGRFDMLRWISVGLGVPLVAFHAGSQPESYLGTMVRYWTLRQADVLIASSREELQMLHDRFRVRRERLEIILTPIDTLSYRPLEREAACRAAGLDPARRYVLFVGRLDDAVKQIAAQIDAFADLLPQRGDMDFVIAGDGPDRERLQRRAAARAGARIHFAGWISDVARKIALYNAAECLLLPSLHEGFPTVIGEALACGTPVLASRVGGVPEVVEHGTTGWLIPPGDVTALRCQLTAVLNDPAGAAALRPRAREVALRRLSPEAVGAELERVINRVCRRRRNGAGGASSAESPPAGSLP